MKSLRRKGLALALAVCGCLSLAESQVHGIGSCPSKLQSQSTFNITRYLGQWYEMQSFPTAFERGERCVSANYSLKGDSHINVLNRGYKAGEYLEASGDAYCPDPSKPAQLLVRLSNAASSANYWVIETDYENYSLVFSCHNLLNFGHAEFAWILSRWPQLDPPTVNHLKSLLTDAGVNVGHFQEMVQSECPGRPGSL